MLFRENVKPWSCSSELWTALEWRQQGGALECSETLCNALRKIRDCFRALREVFAMVGEDSRCLECSGELRRVGELSNVLRCCKEVRSALESLGEFWRALSELGGSGVFCMALETAGCSALRHSAVFRSALECSGGP